MIPPIFQYAAASTAVKAALGSKPVRFWPFDSSPQPGQAGYGLPYAVWQLVYGSPSNYLGQVPDSDNTGIQVDAYAPTATLARDAAIALRGALEPHGYVVSYTGESRDPPTGLYRVGFTVEFWTDR